MYKPTDKIPGDEELQRVSESLSHLKAERMTAIKDYKNARKGIDSGHYTCVVHHGSDHDPAYSIAMCDVFIDDPDAHDLYILGTTITPRITMTPPTSFPTTTPATNKDHLCAESDCKATTASTSPTQTSEVDDLTPTAYTCTAFPGGVIDDFNARSHFYDLTCTHILAADLMPGGSFHNPWFIYGTYDNHDGKTALMSMTFYLGRDIFEVQRGWLLLTEGSKLPLEEGVAEAVGSSGCWVKFADLHIVVDCPNFEAYYDGIMSGHIKLKIEAEESLFQKGSGNIGLCFDNQSGYRPNWQIGRTTGRCQVNTEEPPCETETPTDCNLSRPPLGGKEHTTCGVGAERACSELHCNGNTPTSVQRCALAQANRVNCSLKRGLGIFGSDEDCDDEPCVWKKEIVSRG